MTDDEIVNTEIRVGQTAKDVLGHLSAWEYRLVTWLRAAAAGQTREIPEPGATWNDIDRINKRTFLENRSHSLDTVRASSAHVFKSLQKEIQALPDDLQSDLWRVWRDGEPPWKLIAANTYEHYQHHTVPIEDWLAKHD